MIAVLVADFHGWLERWAPAAEWAVAGGTVLLALATFLLARQAAREASNVADEAKQVGDQVTLQREQMELAARPVLYPSTPRGWVQGIVEWQERQGVGPLLPIKNAGPGPALNVEGKAYWPNEGGGAWTTLTLYGGTVAPGEDSEARTSGGLPPGPGWMNSKGYLTYNDLNGVLWLTEFVYKAGEGGQLVCEHKPPEQIDEDLIWRRYPPDG